MLYWVLVENYVKSHTKKKDIHRRWNDNVL